jgi:hypothetical protein
MKCKIILLLVVVFLVTSCSNQETVESTPTSSNKNVGSIRSYAEALKIAQEAIPLLNKETTTRSESNNRKIDLNEKMVYKLDAKTRANNSCNDTLIYVFNFENNKGFALVSASLNTEGLLAITEKGHCDPCTRSNVCGFDFFVDMAKDYVANSNRDFVDYKDSIFYATYDYVGPYVTVKWGQSNPEGEFCPNGIAGCTNTAMVQIMSYYQYPSSIELTYEERDKSSQALYWGAMKNHSTGHAVGACGDTITHRSIGRLHRQLGELNHSTYNTSSTSTNSLTYAKPTFVTLGYTCGDWDDYSGASARSWLNNAHIYLMRGADRYAGHAWVFDGYMTKTEAHYEMVNYGSGWVPTGEIHYRTLYYNHMNWGWYGTNNGYFSENVYNTSQATYWDTTSHYVNYDFCYFVQLLGVYY